MFYGWWVVAAAFVTFGLSVGLPYYNIPFFYDYFEAAYQWRRVDITRGFFYATLLTLWVGPVLIPRFHAVLEEREAPLGVLFGALERGVGAAQ